MPAVIALLVFLHVAVLANSRLLPFVDLPFHLAASTILRYFDSPENHFAGYYALELGLKPNLLHTWLCSLGFFPSVEFANKLLLALYVALLPLSVFLILRRAGASPWWTL